MANDRRKLIIHTGAGKTGSSALQAYFLANLNQLAAQDIGFSHPSHISRPDEITSGNGLALLHALEDNVDTLHLMGLLESYCGKEYLSICSSEMLSHLTVEQLDLLKNTSEQLAIDLTFVVFVRDVESYYASAYNQMVKRHGEHRSYLDYTTASPDSYYHLKHLRRLLQVFEKSTLRVISYEATRDSVDLVFWNSLGLPHDMFDRGILAKTVNRGLVSCELDFLRQINKALGDKYSKELSDYLIYARPELAEPQNLDNTVLALLSERYQQDVDWVNEQFFSGNKVIKVESTGKHRLKPLSKSLTAEIATDVVGWLVGKLASKDVLSNSFSAELAGLVRWVCDAPGVQLDVLLDAPHYLRTYPDVAAAGMNPLTHYLEYGLNEGRQPAADLHIFLAGAIEMRERQLKSDLEVLGPQIQDELAQVQQRELSHLVQIAQLKDDFSQKTLELVAEQASKERQMLEHVINLQNELDKTLTHIGAELTHFAGSDERFGGLLEKLTALLGDTPLDQCLTSLEENLRQSFTASSEQSLAALESIGLQFAMLSTQLNDSLEKTMASMASIAVQGSSSAELLQEIQSKQGRQAQLQQEQWQQYTGQFQSFVKARESHAAKLDVFAQKTSLGIETIAEQGIGAAAALYAIQKHQDRQSQWQLQHAAQSEAVAKAKAEEDLHHQGLLREELKAFNQELVRMNAAHLEAKQAYENKITSLSLDLDSVRASLSWRATLPFRALWKGVSAFKRLAPMSSVPKGNDQ